MLAILHVYFSLPPARSCSALSHRLVGSSETSYLPALVSHEQTISQTFNTFPVAMSTVNSPQWPGFDLVQVSNISHSLEYQQYEGMRFHCSIKETNELEKLLKGAEVMAENGRRLGEEKDGTTVESLGFETIDDVYCRKFVISQIVVPGEKEKANGASGMSAIRIYVWEDFGARKLHRLQLNNQAWVVKRLIPITHEGDNVLPLEAFDIESILATCDHKDIRPAPRIHPDVLTDVLIPDPRYRKRFIYHPCTHDAVAHDIRLQVPTYTHAYAYDGAGGAKSSNSRIQLPTWQPGAAASRSRATKTASRLRSRRRW